MELLSLRFAGGVPAEQASLDLLCIAPHPDDAELGMGAVLAQESARGLGVGILDLSRGELASNGTPEQRLQESAEAARILGLRWRGNLGLRDRALEGPNAQEALITALRVLRPVALFIPHPRDPHPDHGAAHRLHVLRHLAPVACHPGDMDAQHHDGDHQDRCIEQLLPRP